MYNHLVWEPTLRFGGILVTVHNASKNPNTSHHNIAIKLQLFGKPPKIL